MNLQIKHVIHGSEKRLLTWKGNRCLQPSAAFEGVDELQKCLWQDLSENQQTLTQITQGQESRGEILFFQLPTYIKANRKRKFPKQRQQKPHIERLMFLEANTEITQCQASHSTTQNALEGNYQIQRDTLQGRGVRKKKLTTSAPPNHSFTNNSKVLEPQTL